MNIVKDSISLKPASVYNSNFLRLQYWDIVLVVSMWEWEREREQEKNTMQNIIQSKRGG